MRLLPGLVLMLSLNMAACGHSVSFQDDLEAAQNAAAEQDWAQTARLSQRFLREEMNPEKRWIAWNLMVKAALHMGEVRWAVDDLEIMLQEYGQNEAHAAVILRQLGDAYERMRQWDKAAMAWMRLLDVEEFSPDESARLYLRMGIFFLRGQDFGMAEDMLEMCLADAGDSDVVADCHFYLAQAYANDKKTDEALAQVSALVDMQEASSSLRGEALFLRGDLLEQEGKNSEALAAFNEALGMHPNPTAIQKRVDYLSKKSGISTTKDKK